jgi:ubiquinone/menaquinone biosynthesis C-methylase UbiE
MSDELRKESERQFHNRRFGSGSDFRKPLDKWYLALGACTREQNELVRRYGKGGTVLEYGCADARISLGNEQLANEAASYHGIDISDQAIDVARKSASSQGLTNCEFTVMDAENLTFPDDKFDLVFGRGILHHLDLGRCFREIARVLRPGARAIFSEPLGHNPALNLFRKMTPHLRTPDEHPLVMSDLRFAEAEFRSVNYRFFGMTTLLALPFQRTFIASEAMGLCEKVDALLLRSTLIGRNAWSMLLVLGK